MQRSPPRRSILEGKAALDSLAAQVKQHGCCSLPGVSIDFWKLQPLIERAVDRGFVSREHGAFALNGLWFGFDMGVDVCKVKGRRWFSNYASAHEAKDKVTSAIRTRVEQAKTLALCCVEKCSAHSLPWPHCRVFPLGAVAKPLEPDAMRPVSDHTKSGLKAATDRDSLRHSLRTYEEIAEFLRYGFSMRMIDVEGAFPLLPLAPMLWPFFMLWWFRVWEGSESEMFIYVHLTADFGAAGVPGTWKVFFTDVIVGVARSEQVITLPMPEAPSRSLTTKECRLCFDWCCRQHGRCRGRTSQVVAEECRCVHEGAEGEGRLGPSASIGVLVGFDSAHADAGVGQVAGLCFYDSRLCAEALACVAGDAARFRADAACSDDAAARGTVLLGFTVCSHAWFVVTVAAASH